MCGVSGYFGEFSVGNTFIEDANKILKHRGPDSKGSINLDWSGLGHTRLALISPGQDGDQPVNGANFVMSFNGEIYNWREIQQELSSVSNFGLINSDSLALFAAIETWGIEKTLPKLRGMFSFALLDKRDRTLILVRDSSGTKPLYFTQRNGTTFVSSEIKAFKNFGLSINREQLDQYLTFQNNFTHETIYKEVFLVPQGAILKFHRPEQSPVTQIWDTGFFRSDSEISAKEAVEELDNLVQQSVRRNLVADFPIGCFLSGGLDSSVIGIISKRLKPDTDYFTVGFDLASNQKASNFKDERLAARLIANKFGMNLNEYIVSSSMFERYFDEISWAIEEPRVGQSYPNYFAIKSARQRVKGVMSGAGGDELFGGYPWRYRNVLESSNLGKETQLEKYLEIWHRLGDLPTISNLIGVDQKLHKENALNSIRNILDQNSRLESNYQLEDLLYFEYKTFLNGLLIVDDKLAMNQGVEIRLPFLDQDLVKFAQNLPDSLRIERSPGPESHQGKILLRKLASKLNNPASQGRKQGFTGPDEVWFKSDLAGFVKDRLLDTSGLIWSYLDFGVGSNLVKDHLSNKQNNRSLIWSLLSLESTLRKYT